MKRAIALGFAVGVPLAVGFALLANAVSLPRGVLLALFFVVVGLPSAVGVLADQQRH